jgi:hypothetical protein
MHSHVHTFPDIMAKGAVINYDTKPSEGTHGKPKATYKHLSNGKEFEDLVRLHLSLHQAQLIFPTWTFLRS